MAHCIFCDIVENRAPAVKVFEDERVLAFFTIGPVADYHTLVIPKRHARDVFDVSADDWLAVCSVVHRIAAAYRSHLGMTDIQIITSNGANAQQDVFHLHVHIVPRAAGDAQDISWREDPMIASRFDELRAAIAFLMDET